ncbi:MAG: hypothetical protein ACJ8BE_15250, partial [Microvirga sp.]
LRARASFRSSPGLRLNASVPLRANVEDTEETFPMTLRARKVSRLLCLAYIIQDPTTTKAPAPNAGPRGTS